MPAQWVKFDLEGWLKRVIEKQEKDLDTLADNYAVRIETWMKQNAAWQDQTGNARRLLKAEVRQAAGQLIITMSHGVPYGEELEHHRTGKYAILAPAMDFWFPKIVADVKVLVGGGNVLGQG